MARKTQAPRLTLKQARFIAEYLKDLNGTQAAIRAGYARSNADFYASRLLSRANISQLVEAGQRRQLAKAELCAQMVKDAIKRNVADAAYGDKRRFFTASGKLRRVVDLTPDEADLLAGFEVIIKNAAAGDGHTDTVHKITLRRDHVQWTELAAKHLGMLIDVVRLEVSEAEMAELDVGRQANAEARRLREAERLKR